jgi:DNA-directed DNA polymerase III PolC
MSTGFVHLNVHSNYSMLGGASRIDELVGAASRQGMNSLALTDIDGLYAAVPFARACRAHEIRPVFGVDLTEPESGNPGELIGSSDRESRRAILLARNPEGYRMLCRIITERHLAVRFDWESSVAGLPESVYVLSSDDRVLRRRLNEFKRQDATYMEVCCWGSPDDRYERDRRLALSEKLTVPAVATNDVWFASSRDHAVHRLLTALRLKTTVGKIPGGKTASPAAYLAGAEDMVSRFPGAPGIVKESLRIARNCCVDLDLDRRKLPRYPVPGDGDAHLYLRGLALKGLSDRYDPKSVNAARRVLERELTVIRKLDLADYFLICHDIVDYARSRLMPCLGRGSAANSIVSYCLYITHVDPLAHNLFFERFLNDQRTSLPDFDLDFGTEDREEVLDYIFDTYGRDRVAMIGTHVTFQLRGAFRETAAALGLPKGEVDDFIKRLPHVSNLENLEEKLASSPETRSLPLDREPFATIRTFAERIGGFPRHMATHPCGLVIVPDSLSSYMPLQRGDKGLPITQWSMYPVEDAGLLKIDILGQKGLEVISNTVRSVREQGMPVPADPRIFMSDLRTREWMRRGSTIGCFYIESPAMINLIRQARCDDFECLTALSSIIRPGVSNYGGKHSYLRRHLKLEPETVLHPLLKPILSDTKGCLIYQEQVIRIASELAELSLGEADDLRRLMSFKKNRKQLSDYREMFYRGCRKRDIPEAVIDEIYRQVESFAGYAFCKAHSASFAMESFESMYYKSHHPAEFMAAILTGGGGYYGSLEYLEEARRLGIAIHPPCINGSDYRFTGRDGHLRVGLMQVKSLRKETAETIISSRCTEGPYRDLIDFLKLVRMTQDEARNLVRCGAMRSLGRTIPELLWGIEIFHGSGAGQLEPHDHLKRSRDLWQQVPQIADPPISQRLAWELEILGMTPSAHPFRLFPDEVSQARRLRPIVRSVDLEARAGRETYVLGWRIIGKKTRTKSSGELMIFLTFSDEWGRFEATFFPVSFERNAHELLRGRGPFLMKGRVETEFGVPMVVAERVQLLVRRKLNIRNTAGPIRKSVPQRKHHSERIRTKLPL